MRLEGLGRVGGWHASIPITPVFILLGTSIVRTSEGLQRVHDDKVPGTNGRIREICPETTLEDGEDGFVVWVDGR